MLTSLPLNSSSRSHINAIKKVNQNITIQSILFDVNNGSLSLATGWDWAANNNWKKHSISPPIIKEDEQSNTSIKLVRNLDWPWPILGSEAICVCTDPGDNKPQFVNVTFPGYLGVLSGMNNQKNRRIALACNQVGGFKQAGLPVTLLLRRILEEATTTNEALKIISENRPASSMNITIVGQDGIAKVELDPSRQQMGYAHAHLIQTNE